MLAAKNTQQPPLQQGMNEPLEPMDIGSKQKLVSAEVSAIIYTLFGKDSYGERFFTVFLEHATLQPSPRLSPGLYACIKTRRIQDLAKMFGWGYDTVHKYVILFCALNLMAKHKAGEEQIFTLTLSQYQPPTSYDMLVKLTQHSRPKVRQMAERIYKRLQESWKAAPQPAKPVIPEVFDVALQQAVVEAFDTLQFPGSLYGFIPQLNEKVYTQLNIARLLADPAKGASAVEEQKTDAESNNDEISPLAPYTSGKVIKIMEPDPHTEYEYIRKHYPFLIPRTSLNEYIESGYLDINPAHFTDPYTMIGLTRDEYLLLPQSDQELLIDVVLLVQKLYCHVAIRYLFLENKEEVPEFARYLSCRVTYAGDREASYVLQSIYFQHSVLLYETLNEARENLYQLAGEFEEFLRTNYGEREIDKETRLMQEQNAGKGPIQPSETKKDSPTHRDEAKPSVGPLSAFSEHSTSANHQRLETGEEQEPSHTTNSDARDEEKNIAIAPIDTSNISAGELADTSHPEPVTTESSSMNAREIPVSEHDTPEKQTKQPSKTEQTETEETRSHSSLPATLYQDPLEKLPPLEAAWRKADRAKPEMAYLDLRESEEVGGLQRPLVDLLPVEVYQEWQLDNVDEELRNVILTFNILYFFRNIYTINVNKRKTLLKQIFVKNFDKTQLRDVSGYYHPIISGKGYHPDVIAAAFIHTMVCSHSKGYKNLHSPGGFFVKLCRQWQEQTQAHGKLPKEAYMALVTYSHLTCPDFVVLLEEEILKLKMGNNYYPIFGRLHGTLSVKELLERYGGASEGEPDYHESPTHKKSKYKRL